MVLQPSLSMYLSKTISFDGSLPSGSKGKLRICPYWISSNMMSQDIFSRVFI